ncbi:TetR/AcrR family transcriptional regulator [bacterium]|nr:TetR/AcrR family transcriptional regulator [bacterium]
MTKAQETRQRIISTTMDLLMQQGYHATGLNQIVQESNAPKGSLYFHFPKGKEEIVAEALNLAGEWTCSHVAEALQAHDSVADAVAAITLSFAHLLEEDNYGKSCALLTVAQEVGDDDVLLRKALDEGFAGWYQLFVDMFVKAQFPQQAAERWADLTLSAIEGAQALARGQRSVRPLENTAAMLRLLIGNAQQMYDMNQG